MAIIDPVVLNILTSIAWNPLTSTLTYTDEQGNTTDVTLSVGFASGAASPVGNRTPAGPNEAYIQIAPDRIVNWLSTGTTNTDWIATGGTAIQQTNSPNEAPAYAGQIWQNVTVTSTGFVAINEVWTGANPNGNPDGSSWIRLLP